MKLLILSILLAFAAIYLLGDTHSPLLAGIAGGIIASPLILGFNMYFYRNKNK